jgi:hypothetical protein
MEENPEGTPNVRVQFKFSVCSCEHRDGLGTGTHEEGLREVCPEA